MLVNTTNPVPTTPLHEPISAIDIKPLLTVPVERARVSLKFLQRAEFIACGKHEALQCDRTRAVLDVHLETLQRELAGHRLGWCERIPGLDLLPIDRDDEPGVFKVPMEDHP
jgi:hypothetical protein